MSFFLKSSLLVGTLMLANITGFSQNVLGYWKTIDDNSGDTKSVVQVYKNPNGEIQGKVVKLYRKPGEDPDPACVECPKDDHRHGKKIKGMVIMSGMKIDGNACSGGEIMDPENGSSYRCKIWTEGNDVLKVRGYLGPFYRTQTWKRERGFSE